MVPLLTILGLVLAPGSVALAQTSALRIPLHTATVSLDPTGIQDSHSLWVARQLNCQLMRVRGRELVNELAEDVKYITPTELRMVLVNGKTFSDGSPVRAEDVVATLEHLRRSRKVLRNVFDVMKSVRAVDERTLSIQLSRPSPTFLRFLAAPNYAIFPVSFLKRATRDPSLWRSPVGCGDYRVREWRSDGAGVRLSPVSQGRDIDFVFTGKTQLTLEQARTYDFLDVPYSDQFKDALSKDAGGPSGAYRTERVFDPKQILIGLNSRLPRWRNRADRCDFFSRLNPSQVVASYGSIAEVSRGLIPRGVLGHSEITPSTMEKPVESKVSAVARGPICLSFLALSVPAGLRDSYRKMLPEEYPLGSVQVIDDARRFTEIFQQSRCDALVIGLKSNYLDGYEILLFFSENAANFTGHSDSRLSNEILKSQQISDPAERSAVYQSLEARVRSECLAAPVLTIPFRSVLVRRSLSTPGIGEVAINEYPLKDVR